jgi:hypothetical protein
MTVSKTQEQIAVEIFYAAIQAHPQVRLISWHPPDSKSYITNNLRIPIVNESNLRRREHIDFIIVVQSTLLMLLEAKGSLSESVEDITKLRRIIDQYSLNDLVILFRRQGAIFKEVPTAIQLGLIVSSADTPIPQGFVVFECHSSFGIRIHVGEHTIENIANSVIQAFG